MPHTEKVFLPFQRRDGEGPERVVHRAMVAVADVPPAMVQRLIRIESRLIDDPFPRERRVAVADSALDMTMRIGERTAWDPIGEVIGTLPECRRDNPGPEHIISAYEQWLMLYRSVEILMMRSWLAHCMEAHPDSHPRSWFAQDIPAVIGGRRTQVSCTMDTPERFCALRGHLNHIARISLLLERCGVPVDEPPAQLSSAGETDWDRLLLDLNLHAEELLARLVRERAPFAGGDDGDEFDWESAGPVLLR